MFGVPTVIDQATDMLTDQIAAQTNANGLIERRVQTAPNADTYRPWTSMGVQADRFAVGQDRDGRLELAYLLTTAPCTLTTANT